MRGPGTAYRTRQIGRRIGGRLTYANVMATIAVFGVLAGGGAYAASRIGSKDIEKNAIRAKHIKQGAVKTPEIANGAVTEAKLAEGLQGPPGPVTGDLPSGATLRGVFNVDFRANAAEDIQGGEISFGLRLPAKPAVVVRTEGAPPTTQCPGSATSPEAAPATLCIYESTHANAQPLVACDMECDPTAERFGAQLFVRSSAAGRAFINGSWAVTAP